MGDNAGNGAYAALNEYSTITGAKAESVVKYDADGNLTQAGAWTYTYDAENRMKSAAGGTYLISFIYDYADRRINKSGLIGSTPFGSRYIWAGWTLVAETGTDGFTITRSFIWGPDFSNAQGAAGGAGALLGQYSTGAVLAYAIPDVQGNIVGYLDSSGNFAAAREYSLYGERINTYGTQSGYPIGYAGQYTDEETGLVYYGLRYYSPRHGRFINRDPIEEAGGNNLYGFCGDDPIDHWDVLGQSWLSNAMHKVQRWSKKHSLGATLLGLEPFASQARARDTWHFAQKNPEIAAVVAAVATWYVGGIGAAAFGLEGAGAATFSGAAAGFGGGFVGARASGASISDSFHAGFTGALVGGMTAGMLSGIDEALPSWMNTAPETQQPGWGWFSGDRVLTQLERMGARGFVRGVASEITGGSFSDAFRSTAYFDTADWAMDVWVEARFNYETRRQDLRDLGKTYSSSELDNPTWEAGGAAVPKPEHIEAVPKHTGEQFIPSARHAGWRILSCRASRFLE